MKIQYIPNKYQTEYFKIHPQCHTTYFHSNYHFKARTEMEFHKNLSANVISLNVSATTKIQISQFSQN